MMKTRPTFAVACCLVLGAAVAGCAGYGQTPALSAGSAAAGSGSSPASLCNAQPAQFVVGQNSTASVVESARQRSGAQTARILRPGQIITKEYDTQRLNLEVDGTGRILAAKCG
ncbi:MULTISPECIES: I78 family peptidase inhibitor [unclassified Acidovorax]|uniref:I78 family peptidase inhibitor n=1 Tax=unclassified Acidovorax TaxID=2684926 RepID=UPI000C19D5B7|nr:MULTISPECIES: I78 family peptidase inhibitor [unclassified Acidovorax]PIF19188.1 peptidase inhibitor I78 family protein [Acidovorax sp. 59]PKW01784.1 peptidase inhibitor I78 family protein [Acidovorax sp. 30]